jgi:hypothetical protein
LLGITASPKALGPEAGEEQCLGDMPWIGRATAIKPDTISVVQSELKVKQRNVSQSLICASSPHVI